VRADIGFPDPSAVGVSKMQESREARVAGRRPVGLGRGRPLAPELARQARAVRLAEPVLGEHLDESGGVDWIHGGLLSGFEPVVRWLDPSLARRNLLFAC
jgi:hypothetical protein